MRPRRDWKTGAVEWKRADGRLCSPSLLRGVPLPRGTLDSVDDRNGMRIGNRSIDRAAGFPFLACRHVGRLKLGFTSSLDWEFAWEHVAVWPMLWRVGK